MICNLTDLGIWMREQGLDVVDGDVTQPILELIAASRSCLPEAIAELEKAKAALDTIAIQKTADELEDYEKDGDYVFAHDTMVYMARQALQSITEFEKKWGKDGA